MVGSASRSGDTRWGAVALGWAVAAFASVFVNLLLRLSYTAFAGPTLDTEQLTMSVIVVAILSGFLSYLIGGYVAARIARRSGGKHGALTAVFGLVVGLLLGVVLFIFGITFESGVAVTPANFGLAGAALLAGLILFLANMFGGYVGGKLGEPGGPDFEGHG